MPRCTSLIALASTFLPAAFGQLGQIYLIAGAPRRNSGAGYGAVLVGVAPGGSLEAPVELVPKSVGTEWISVSYDARKAVLFSKSPDARVIVVDFDAAPASKSCQDPDGGDLARLNIVDLPSRGFLFVGDAIKKGKETEELLGMSLDPGVPCEKSFAEVEDGDLKFVVAGGSAGAAGIGGDDRLDVALLPDGSLVAVGLNGDRVYFDYKVPPALFSDMKIRRLPFIVSSNSQIFTVYVVGEASGLLVFRKSDSTWHRIPDFPFNRAFGNFIVSTEGHILSGQKAEGATPEEAYRRVTEQAVAESAGKGEWKQLETPTGPPFEDRLRSSETAYPGILRIYNAATEKSYTITTNQADSEILLVENSTVYYRVTNRLYSAPIAGDSIGAATLLATDDLIEDAHWAFISKGSPATPDAPAAPAGDLLSPSTLNQTAPADYRAKFTTTKGDIVIEVTRDWSPLGADRLYNLVQAGFFTDSAFYRVIPNFMAQFGVSARPEVTQAFQGAKIMDEPVKQSNKRGKVSFAGSGPNTRSTALFINTVDNSRLDPLGFAPIGEVVEGMANVDMLYRGYGETADHQPEFEKDGKTYVDRTFPKLDRILSATILPEAAPAPKQ